MNEHDKATKAVIHDGNGTWFAPDGLHLTLLTADELEQLESGDEHLLNTFEGAPLDVLLAESVDYAEIEWRW